MQNFRSGSTNFTISFTMIDEAGEFVKMEDLSKSQSSLSKKAKIELQQYLATVFENSSQVITDKSVFIAGATMVDYLRNEFIFD